MTAPIMNFTMAVHGPPKSGKTWFAATFPRPVFISAAPERGWTALPRHENWPNITVLPCPLVPGQEQISGDPNAAPPPDYAIVKDSRPRFPIEDMEYIVLKRIQEEYQQRNWQTVVVDTVTLYDQQVVSQLSEYGKREMGGKGGGQWTVVKQHMLNMINSLQSLPLNVVWVFHSQDIKTGDIIMRTQPSAVGKHWRDVFAPRVRMIGYMHKEQIMDQATKEIETQRSLLVKCPKDFTPPFEAGGDYEECFTGKDWCLVPTWDSLAKRLNKTINVNVG